MELILLAVLLVVVAEVTYLVATQFTKDRRTAVAPVFIDTSVLIDGRIIAIAASGFMNRPLYIPRSVVGELQFLADTGDSDKRARARHGLDIINELQSMPRVTVKIFADGVRAKEGVDNRLLDLAKKHGGAVCTIDYNLNKVAVVEGVEVLNVNDLAKTLRMAYLPGERTMIDLTQKGNDSHQAVGHLSDGTMVVVEHASKHLGSRVEVEFTRGLQTAAGKMMFAKITQPAAPEKTAKAVRVPKLARVQKVPAATATGRKPQARPVQNQNTPEDAPAPQPAPARNAQTTRPPKKPGATGAQRQNPRRAANRRRSPEDSMVELANQE